MISTLQKFFFLTVFSRYFAQRHGTITAKQHSYAMFQFINSPWSPKAMPSSRRAPWWLSMHCAIAVPAMFDSANSAIELFWSGDNKTNRTFTRWVRDLFAMFMGDCEADVWWIFNFSMLIKLRKAIIAILRCLIARGKVSKAFERVANFSGRWKIRLKHFEAFQM